MVASLIVVPDTVEDEGQRFSRGGPGDDEFTVTACGRVIGVHDSALIWLGVKNCLGLRHLEW